MQDGKAVANADESMEMIHGRLFNKSNKLYYLPSDLKDRERLNKAHEAVVIGMGDIYPCPELVEAILAPVEGEGPKQVLDAGCGTGIWSFEMASRFPHAQVKGVDISPLRTLSPYPSNFSFETQDLNDDLSRFHNLFDLIHVKNVMGGIKDADKTLKEIELCLKPGGLLIVIEGSLFVREDKEQYVKLAKLDGETAGAVDENGSWLNRMVLELVRGSVISGNRNGSSHKVVDLGPWDHELCDPDWSASGSIYNPVGPWAEGSTEEETQALKHAGRLTQDGFMEWNKIVHAGFLSFGLDQSTLDDWSQKIDEELMEVKHKMWLRERFFWTRRRQAEGLPAPSLSNSQGTVIRFAKNISQSRYTMMEIYPSKEETLVRMEKRDESLRDLPLLVVERAWKEKQKVGSSNS